MPTSVSYLLFDFETSDLYNKKLPPGHLNQAWPVQVGALYLDSALNILNEISEFVAPPHQDAIITKGAFDTHGITIETCRKNGITYDQMRTILKPIISGTARPIGHNIWFVCRNQYFNIHNIRPPYSLFCSSHIFLKTHQIQILLTDNQIFFPSNQLKRPFNADI